MGKSLTHMWNFIDITANKEQEIIKSFGNLDKKSQEYKDTQFQIIYKLCHQYQLTHREMIINTYWHKQNLLREQKEGVSKNRVQPSLNEIESLPRINKNIILNLSLVQLGENVSDLMKP